MQGGGVRKRRPLSGARTVRKVEGESQVQQEQGWIQPQPNSLIAKKYYYPAIAQEERHVAFLLSRFVTGHRSRDVLKLAELMGECYNREVLRKVYQKSHMALRWAIADNLQAASRIAPSPHFFSSAHFILHENSRRKRQIASTFRNGRKDELRSTNVDSKKEIKKILSDGLMDHPLNESQQLSKLSRCLKKVLGKRECGRAYRAFMAEMEVRGNAGERSQGMLNFILNLQKDFSSIQQEQGYDFSQESIYGLSELKKKSQRNHSKVQMKTKDKRMSTNFPFCRIDFAKRSIKDQEKTSNCHSTSKNSRKSSSMRGKKGNTATPDNHGVKSKSKSSVKKGGAKVVMEKKGKLSDTMRLYFDETPDRIQEKTEGKSILKEGGRKVEGAKTKSKKKGQRR